MIVGMYKRGFTLVELMIVITIMAILATIAVMSFSRVQKQARDIKRKAEVKTIRDALQGYYVERGSFPLSSAPAAASSVLSVLSPTFMSNIPAAPSGTAGTNSDYMYVTNSTGAIYGICVQLETSAEPGSMWKVDTGNAAGRETTNADCTAQ